MIYTELTKKALRICFEAHKEHVDKGGLPYVFHPFHLAEQMSTEEEVCTALLHDVMEDTDATAADLRGAGIPDTVLEALLLLTRNKAVPYPEYIEAIKNNPLAATVKRADLRHNLDQSRLDQITEEDRRRIAKYRNALAVLSQPAADATSS